MAPKSKAKINDFVEGDLVAAKVKGYPFWPGRVVKVAMKGSRKEYTVKFFQSNDTATKLQDIKPFSQMTESDRRGRADKLEAIRLCQEEYDRMENGDNVTTSPEKSQEADEDNHQSMIIDEENNLKIDEKPAKKTTKSKVQTEDETGDTPKSPVSKPTRKSSNIIQDIPRKTKQQKSKHETKQQTKKHKSNSTTTSNNRSGGLESSTTNDDDLKRDATKDIAQTGTNSNKVPTDVTDNSLSVSSIDHNHLEQTTDNVYNPAFLKLEMKLKAKLEEKDALKRSHFEKKLYEKSSSKFPAIHKRLDHILDLTEDLLRNGVDHSCIITKLERAHKNLEPTLRKCIDILTSEYGRKQNDFNEFREKLIMIVERFQEIREATKKKNPQISKVVKRLRKVYKGDEKMKNFINMDAISERKENDAIKKGYSRT